MPDEPPDDKAPYLSFTTLTNFLDKWGDGPIPPRIDKSALDNYSGGTQAILLATLRLIGYVDQDGQVLTALRESIASVEARKKHLAGWARQFYADQLALAEANATAGMLHESFAPYGYNGSTLRKAVVFYLALVEYVGLPNSPHFRAPKQGPTPTARRRTRAVVPPPESAEPVRSADTMTFPKGETTVVRIGDRATITIVVDAEWMKLPVETITSMRQAIADLEALESGQPIEADPT